MLYNDSLLFIPEDLKAILRSSCKGIRLQGSARGDHWSGQLGLQCPLVALQNIGYSKRGLADGSTRTVMSDGSAQLEDQSQEMGLLRLIADQILILRGTVSLRLFA